MFDPVITMIKESKRVAPLGPLDVVICVDNEGDPWLRLYCPGKGQAISLAVPLDQFKEFEEDWNNVVTIMREQVKAFSPAARNTEGN